MRIGAEANIMVALSRFQESQKPTPRPQGGGEPGASRSVSDAAGAFAPPSSKRVNTAADTERSQTGLDRRGRDGEAEDGTPFEAQAFGREAPNGPRPKYIPKGQAVNVLV